MSKGASLCVEGPSQDALGHILSDEPEIMGVFRVLPQVTPPEVIKPRLVSQQPCLSDHSSWCKAIRWLSLLPPCGFFLNDFFLCRPRRVSFAPWAASKALIPHFDAFQPLARYCSCGTGCLIMSTCPCWDRGEHDASLEDVDVAWAGNSSRFSLLLAPSLTLRRVGWLEASFQPWWSWRSFCRASARWFCCWYWC